MLTIDLNSDLGEGFGPYRCGDDDAMLSIVTSANVACGFHAGDPEVMTHTFRVAKARGVRVGAHPGFPDLWGFGRRRIPFSAGEIERLVAYQIGAAQALAAYAGHRITHVKAHGALGNMAEVEPDIADAIAHAVRSVAPSLILLAIARSQQIEAAERAGIAAIAEIFADRGYSEAGRLIPRGQKGALIEDPDEAADRVFAMINDGAIITTDGKHLKTAIGSICVHSDSARAIQIAHKVRARLEAGGIAIAGFSAS
jgi:UPF0271 protein